MMNWITWGIWKKHDKLMRRIFAIKSSSDATFYKNVIEQASIQPEYWSVRLMFIYRFGRFLRFHARRDTRRFRFWWKRYEKWNRNIVQGRLNCHIPTGASIGFGTKIWHPYGIVINGKSSIGSRSALRQNVTIGMAKSNKIPSPIIGKQADIGANAAIFGPVILGDNVTIGGGAVVTKSFPDGAKLVGVPAKNIANIEK